MLALASCEYGNRLRSVCLGENSGPDFMPKVVLDHENGIFGCSFPWRHVSIGPRGVARS